LDSLGGSKTFLKVLEGLILAQGRKEGKELGIYWNWVLLEPGEGLYQGFLLTKRGRLILGGAFSKGGLFWELKVGEKRF